MIIEERKNFPMYLDATSIQHRSEAIELFLYLIVKHTLLQQAVDVQIRYNKSKCRKANAACSQCVYNAYTVELRVCSKCAQSSVQNQVCTIWRLYTIGGWNTHGLKPRCVGGLSHKNRVILRHKLTAIATVSWTIARNSGMVTGGLGADLRCAAEVSKKVASSTATTYARPSHSSNENCWQ